MQWDPFRDLIAIQERMNRLFETALTDSDFEGEGSRVGSWSPSADLVENDEALVASLELPGLERDQIEIHLDENVLTIRGERRPERGTPSDQYLRIERAYGPFERRFTLPVGVDPERIAADYSGGVLSVRMPKRPDMAPRTIKVAIT